VKTSKRRARRSSRGVFVLAALIAIAAIVGCSLLRPSRQTPRHAPVSRATAAPVEAVTPEQPQATIQPVASPTVAASPGTEPSAVTTGPRLALIVDDCGQWPDTERGFIALPIPLTLSVLPDVRYTAAIAQEASAAGKGVMLHLPMETVSGMDPGKGKVTTEMSDAQIAAQVDDDLAQVPLAQGVNNHEGSKGSADARVMDDVVRAIVAKRDGLFFIDSRTASNSVAQEVASKAGLATASRDVFIDNVDEETAVEGQLRAAADIAVKNGSAIAIGHPRAATLAAVRALYPELQRRGITFVLARDLTKTVEP
jgi:hypothetical protein